MTGSEREKERERENGVRERERGESELTKFVKTKNIEKKKLKKTSNIETKKEIPKQTNLPLNGTSGIGCPRGKYGKLSN